MFRFENEAMLYWLFLLPALVLLLLLFLYSKRHLMARYGEWPLMQKLCPDFSQGKLILKYSMLMTAFALLILTMANPQMGSKIEKVSRKGIDVILCLDVSNSMNAQDIQPSRLQRSKLAITKLLDKLESDRIGIVVFAGNAYTQLPLTNDFGAAKLFVDIINTDDIQTQGTAIGAAITTAVENFDNDQKSKNSRAIIVISDGENHEDNAVDAAQDARKKDIIVNTIGMGLPDGAPIPVLRNGQMMGYKQDGGGQVVLTKLNEPMLQEIAEAGGGAYVRANNTSAGIETVFKKLDQLDKRSYDARNFSDYESRYRYPLIFALLLLILEFFIFERRNKWINHQTLFSSKS